MELHSQKTRLHPDREDALETVVEGKPGDVIIYHRSPHPLPPPPSPSLPPSHTETQAAAHAGSGWER